MSEYRQTFGARPSPTLAGILVAGQRIGDGGQCRVWRGLRKSDGLEVAVKEVNSTWSADGHDRMLRSALALGRLRSVPWIERLVTVGNAADGALCIVTRYAEGQDLNRRFADGADRRPAELVLAFLRLATALAGVHAHELVHRDVTPRNVLVSVDHDVTLIDFGLALDPQMSRLTACGAGPIGTPGYMSPEQLTNPAEVDHRSDVWQFGVLLDQCRAGVGSDMDLVAPLDQIVMACRRGKRNERAQALTPIVNDLRRILASCVSQMETSGASDDEGLLAGICRVELSPVDVSARGRLAALWRDRAQVAGSPAVAVSALRRAVDLHPSDSDQRRQLAGAHLELARARIGVKAGS